MKKMRLTFLSGVLLVIFFVSCVSFRDREIDVRERSSVKVVDSATVEFNKWQLFNIPSSKRIKNEAYTKLKKIAQENHGVNADVVNIVITGSWTPLEFIHIGVGTGFAVLGVITGIDQNNPANFVVGGSGLLLAFGIGNWQRITATGDIVLYD